MRKLLFVSALSVALALLLAGQAAAQSDHCDGCAELEQEIEQMLLENPMLEAGEEEADATQSVEDDARSADAAGGTGGIRPFA